MDQIIKAIILGAVQGVTEFLPVSSTGHLILFQRLFGLSQETYGLAFDAALHVGTLFAVLWYFRKEWQKLLQTVFRLAFFKPVTQPDQKLLLLLHLATIPAVIIGLLFEDIVDTLFRSPLLVGMSLILFSFVLLYAERKANHLKDIHSLQKKDGVLIGIAQAIALIPGVSRSGITMAAGMWRGLTREHAARFAFLLSAPIVTGAGGKKLLDTIELYMEGLLTDAEFGFFAVGIGSAFIFGYLTIKYFLKYVSSHTLLPFIYYRIVLGFVVILASLNL